MILLPLPGTENLEEKAIPLSKLVSHQLLPPTGQDSLSENSQLSTELPGTKNLAEKRIPVPILEKLYQRPKLDRSSVWTTFFFFRFFERFCQIVKLNLDSIIYRADRDTMDYRKIYANFLELYFFAYSFLSYLLHNLIYAYEFFINCVYFSRWWENKSQTDYYEIKRYCTICRDNCLPLRMFLGYLWSVTAKTTLFEDARENISFNQHWLRSKHVKLEN